jgi:hypothetical protein
MMKFFLLALCAVLAIGSARADLALNSDCQEDLMKIWAGYTNATVKSVDAECDLACRTKCKVILEAAIASSVPASCPTQSDITRCFKLYAPTWQTYIGECAIIVTDEEVEEAEAEAAAAVVVAAAPAAAEAEAGAEAEAENEAGASEGGVCFPAFASTADFQEYLKGEFIPASSTPATSAAPITLFNAVIGAGLAGVAALMAF